jgi:hypothetical protein
MVRFATLQQPLTNSGVRQASFRNQGVSNSNSLFGIVCGLADPPFVALDKVSGNDAAQFSVKGRDAGGAPSDRFSFQGLGLFADSLSC